MPFLTPKMLAWKMLQISTLLALACPQIHNCQLVMSSLTRLSLLVTDLDRTLVGNAEALHPLLQLLDRYRQDYGTKIVYATGRSPALYQELAIAQQLIQPDALISSVVTEIYLGDTEWLAGGWTPLGRCQIGGAGDWIENPAGGWDVANAAVGEYGLLYDRV